MKFRKASSLFLAGAMCLSTFGGAMSVFADEETSSEAAEEETVDYSAEDPITATITVWGPAEDQAEEYGEWLQKRCEAFNELHVNWDLTLPAQREMQERQFLRIHLVLQTFTCLQMTSYRH